MRLPDRIWVPAAAALVLAVVFIGALLVRADGDPSILVHAAPPWTSAADARGSLTVQPEDQGFDGQFFYRLGVAPWSTATTEAGVTFDLPALRNARWGYGALAWVASGGDPDLVPWALIGINVAAATALGAAGGGVARTAGRHHAWGVLLVLWPGFAYSLSLDTAELVASALAFGGLLAVRHRRWALATAALSFAVITRDTTLVVPAGVALAAGWSWYRPADSGRGPARSHGQLVAGLVPVAVFAGWQLVQRARFGALPLTSSGDNNLSAPMAGLADAAANLLPPSGAADALRLVSIVGLVVLLATGGALLVRRRPATVDAPVVVWAAAVAVVVVLNAYLWSGATAFMRAATEAGVVSIAAIVCLAPRRVLALAGSGLAAWWVLTAVAQLSKVG